MAVVPSINNNIAEAFTGCQGERVGSVGELTATTEGKVAGDYQVAGCPLFIRLIPELSAAALKCKLDKELALWYELRAINVTGSGRLTLDDAVAAMVSLFGYSVSTAYRLLKAGDGKLWDIKTPPPATRAKYSYSDIPTGRLSEGQDYYNIKTPSFVIKIYGIFRVAEYLNTPYVSRPVEIPIRAFRGRRTKRAWLYASFFKPDDSRAKPISRDSIKVATGVLRRQQQRYDKVVRIKRVANFAFYEVEKSLVPIFDFVSGKTKQWKVVRRLGNTYRSRAIKASRGMTKKVNGKLKQRSLERDEARLPQKRFFLSPRSLVKSPERHDEAFLLVKKKDRLIKGRMEWCLV